MFKKTIALFATALVVANGAVYAQDDDTPPSTGAQGAEEATASMDSTGVGVSKVAIAAGVAVVAAVAAIAIADNNNHHGHSH